MDTSHPRMAASSALLTIHALVWAAALAAVLTGCQSDPTNPFLAYNNAEAGAQSADAGGSPPATDELDPSMLADADWFEEPPASYANRPDTYRRWHHPGLDAYLEPSAARSDLSEALASKSPIVATNAAILVAHWGAGQPTEHLAAAIRAERLPLALRCAAAEALGRLEEPSFTLHELLGNIAPIKTSPEDLDPLRRETPDLHAALVRALARHADPGDERWFNAALANRAWQVRLEGVAAWQALYDLTLPDAAAELRRDRDPRVRATALRTIAAHRDPRAVGYLQQALDDGDVDVRVAAVAGLRDIGTADAKALLARSKDRGAEFEQAAALVSQSAENVRGDVQSAAAATQSQLRQAVARSLDQAHQRAVQLADETTAAAHHTVRQASAQAEQVVDQARAHAESVQARVREVNELVESLRAANLPEQARREAATALERMATDAQLEVRVQAARAMGEVADPMFLPALMALLSDEADVQLAAMASLAQIAGSDVAAPGGATDDNVRAWQLWYRERPNAPRR